MRSNRPLWTSDSRLHRAIDAEHALSCRRWRQDGSMLSLVDYPAIHELLLAVQAARDRGEHFTRSFPFRGRRYPVAFTSLGRIIVYHPKTGEPIGATAFSSE